MSLESNNHLKKIVIHFSSLSLRNFMDIETFSIIMFIDYIIHT